MAYEAFYYAHESNNTEVVALAGEDQLSIRSAAQRGTGPKGLLGAGRTFLNATGPRPMMEEVVAAPCV